MRDKNGKRVTKEILYYTCNSRSFNYGLEFFYINLTSKVVIINVMCYTMYRS